MIKITATEELEKLPEEIQALLKTTMLEYETTELKEVTGGDVYLIESDEDLLQFTKIFEQCYENNVLTVERFDNVSALENYVEFYYADNNAGGNTAFVPKSIFNQNQILKESYELTIEV